MESLTTIQHTLCFVIDQLLQDNDGVDLPVFAGLATLVYQSGLPVDRLYALVDVCDDRVFFENEHDSLAIVMQAPAPALVDLPLVTIAIDNLFADGGGEG